MPAGVATDARRSPLPVVFGRIVGCRQRGVISAEEAFVGNHYEVRFVSLEYRDADLESRAEFLDLARETASLIRGADCSVEVWLDGRRVFREATVTGSDLARWFCSE